ncbi:MAG: hypothetical protein ACK4MV_10135 [Beijerinckiaceae bacterium]
MSMEQPSTSGPLGYPALKEKQRALRAGFPEALGLRVHRALSWLGRAEAEADDADVRFVLLWIGFNAAYAADVGADVGNERGAFKTFFDGLIALDRDRRIYGAVWSRFPHEIRILLANRYVFAPFWSHQNGVAGYENWEDRLGASQRAIAAALASQDTSAVLSVLFDRLYVLRNQLVHGGATWKSSVNRDQVRDGAAVLGWLLPIFLDLMMDNPSRDWGRPYYPVVE